MRHYNPLLLRQQRAFVPLCVGREGSIEVSDNYLIETIGLKVRTSPMKPLKAHIWFIYLGLIFTYELRLSAIQLSRSPIIRTDFQLPKIFLWELS